VILGLSVAALWGVGDVGLDRCSRLGASRPSSCAGATELFPGVRSGRSPGPSIDLGPEGVLTLLLVGLDAAPLLRAHPKTGWMLEPRCPASSKVFKRGLTPSPAGKP
jgi:hypothetical protein